MADRLEMPPFHQVPDLPTPRLKSSKGQGCPAAEFLARSQATACRQAGQHAEMGMGHEALPGSKEAFSITSP